MTNSQNIFAGFTEFSRMSSR